MKKTNTKKINTEKLSEFTDNLTPQACGLLLLWIKDCEMDGTVLGPGGPAYKDKFRGSHVEFTAAYEELLQSGMLIEPDNTLKLPFWVAQVSATEKHTETLERDFERFYDNYPKKEGRDRAKKKYLAARRKKVTHESIMDGLQRYKAFLKFKDTDRQYIMKPANWLDEPGWENIYETDKQATTTVGNIDALRAKYKGANA